MNSAVAPLNFLLCHVRPDPLIAGFFDPTQSSQQIVKSASINSCDMLYPQSKTYSSSQSSFRPTIRNHTSYPHISSEPALLTDRYEQPCKCRAACAL